MDLTALATSLGLVLMLVLLASLRALYPLIDRSIDQDLPDPRWLDRSPTG
jgi:hypothetical protein